MKWLGLGLAIVIGVAVIAGVAVYLDYRAFLDAPLNIVKDDITINVASGSSVGGVARRLEQQGLLRSRLYFQAYARLSGQAARIKAGDYALEQGMTPRQLLAKLVAGQVIQYSLTIVEGWTFRQMLSAVHNHDKLAPTLKGLSDAEIMMRLGYPDEHPEGRFFPDTYHFPTNTSDLDFLKRAYDVMAQRLADAWQQRSADLPIKTPYEALILASIIEKETGLPEERREIAGVFVRRLRRNMLLQTDPTIIYGLGDAYDGNIRRRDLRADTPYNTYLHRGLPPTPIALPGAESIVAAVNPLPGDSLYFVARGDGGHVFSKTLKEHNQAVREYLKRQ